MDQRAIGVFDSGFGGLTVLKEVHKVLPHESTVYLGDTARLPYGAKSPDTVRRYSYNNARALLEKADLKMLVVACGTASSIALSTLQDALPIPVVGVIEPSVRAALANSQTRSIAILATPATVLTEIFPRTLIEHGFLGQIFAQACPLFVPIVEEGLVEGKIAEEVAAHYMKELPAHVDTVILGCTHFPLLAPLLKQYLPSHVRWIDAGEEVAKKVRSELDTMGQLSAYSENPMRRYLVTDAPYRFEQLCEFFLQASVPRSSVELVDINPADRP